MWCMISRDYYIRNVCPISGGSGPFQNKAMKLPML